MINDSGRMQMLTKSNHRELALAEADKRGYATRYRKGRDSAFLNGVYEVVCGGEVIGDKTPGMARCKAEGRAWAMAQLATQAVYDIEETVAREVAQDMGFTTETVTESPVTLAISSAPYETLSPELAELSNLLIGWNRAKRSGDKAGLIASGDALAEYVDAIYSAGIAAKWNGKA